MNEGEEKEEKKGRGGERKKEEKEKTRQSQGEEKKKEGLNPQLFLNICTHTLLYYLVLLQEKL